MLFSPKAPTAGCGRSLCLRGEKSVIRRSPASNAHGSGSDVNHSMLQWCALQTRCGAPMWGIFRASTPPPSLLPPSFTQCTLNAMSANVGLFIVNFHTPPSTTPTKTVQMWGNVGEFINRLPPQALRRWPLPFHRPPSTVYRPPPTRLFLLIM